MYFELWADMCSLILIQDKEQEINKLQTAENKVSLASPEVCLQSFSGSPYNQQVENIIFYEFGLIYVLSVVIHSNVNAAFVYLMSVSPKDSFHWFFNWQSFGI